MATNEILPFATGVSANVMTPEDYADLPTLDTGFQPGMAFSIQMNTVWRQSSFVAAMIAQFIADSSGEDVLDDGDSATLLDNFITALGNQTRGTQAGSDNNDSYTIAASTSYYTLQSWTLTPLKHDGYLHITAANNVSGETFIGLGYGLKISVDGVDIVEDSVSGSQTQTCIVPVSKGDTPLIEIEVSNDTASISNQLSTKTSWVFIAQ